MGDWRDVLEDLINITMSSSSESSPGSDDSEESEDDIDSSESSDFVEVIDRFNNQQFRENMRLHRDTVHFLIGTRGFLYLTITCQLM